MGLLMKKPGLFTTVQDLGRPGWRKDGIPEGGAMDRYALRMANMLVGNEQGAAGLELTLVGPDMTAERDLLIAVCGAYMSPLIDGEELPMWRPVWVAAGARITFGAALSGCRAYIAVAGGIAALPALGSRSTDTRIRLGGAGGRALQAGDALPCGGASAPAAAPAPSGAAAAWPPWAAAWRAQLAARAAAQPEGRRSFAAPGWFAPPLAYGGGAHTGIRLRVMPGAVRAFPRSGPYSAGAGALPRCSCIRPHGGPPRWPPAANQRQRRTAVARRHPRHDSGACGWNAHYTSRRLSNDRRLPQDRACHYRRPAAACSGEAG